LWANSQGRDDIEVSLCIAASGIVLHSSHDNGQRRNKSSKVVLRCPVHDRARTARSFQPVVCDRETTQRRRNAITVIFVQMNAAELRVNST
jgi:hypothetical protein